MDEIRHKVEIKAPQAAVLAKLNTVDGLASWWTRDTRGDARVGGKLEFYFGGDTPGGVMEVVESTDHSVVWRCVGPPDEWAGEIITFDLETVGDETVLRFTHTWREPIDFMFHCSTKWGFYLLGLKALLETGRTAAFPDNALMLTWK
jgi:hypothetical protein